MEHCLEFSIIDYCINREKGYAPQEMYGVCLSTEDEYCDLIHNSGGFCLICKENYVPVERRLSKNY